MIGLPDPSDSSITAALFDLDGVLTTTAELHQTAWKAVFDEVIAAQHPADDRPFSERDYLDHVDGRPRDDGVREFLKSRGIELPEGSPDDNGLDTVLGIGRRKNDLFLKTLDEKGVDPYPGSVRYLRAVRDAGFAIAVVTSSANGAAVLEAAGLTDYIDARIDGLTLADEHIAGKPAPDSYLAGAKALGVDAAAAAVYEDAVSGVRAGAAGHFGAVVGVDRVGDGRHDEDLRAGGATVVVRDLDELLDDAAKGDRA
ncbi:HAD family hydrolase [Williamsia sterculiae]|uniref:Haloacid dehalogenase superfamily, subfamily IA, variant 3 with third motif having DD or ED/beta-phosphoglucomutase family hydrolase n=1 Tax=Williamsia sterculiae TaxID=1344003 RepID=A0A1N7D2Y5_9NOCA|nr:HAD-IA family hydrolase [Williamsia sterculiae]SIR70065.1 haloacid dehalogenase superfamily, subfamily IA, variant 3 with third motif having DD or ED/beta-phosphoglucomutase family hydrolase [Williamsia sterculiae]